MPDTRIFFSNIYIHYQETDTKFFLLLNIYIIINICIHYLY